ncbi:MAG: LacI family transcriptional regulator [Ramlibacter sp.]|jgi:tripartite-type tricarboxylate transporter receptor subunit TctC|nr:LacI family transcriptional regulator [Ramlibacter sp.]
MRRLVIFALLVSVLFSAWSFPTRPITLVVGFPAGSAPDIAARLLARKLSQRLGQSVVVDNKPGAAGTIAAAGVARAEPDGHTLLLALASANTLGPALYKNVRFDPNTSFAPIGQMVRGAFILSARSDLPVSDLKGLLAYAKKNPGQLAYGSSGNGSLHHLCMEMLKTATGIDVRHIPYKGSTANWQAMSTGEVDLTCDSMTNSTPALQAGRVRPLAVTGEARMESLPRVPTFREQGLPQVNVEFWYGLMAPALTPGAAVTALHAAMAAAVQDPEFVAYFRNQGIDIALSGPDDFARLIRREFGTYSELVQRVGAKID